METGTEINMKPLIPLHLFMSGLTAVLVVILPFLHCAHASAWFVKPVHMHRSLALATLEGFAKGNLSLLSLPGEPAPVPTTPAPTTRMLTACGTLNRPRTTYALGNDVSSPGTCFVVGAQDITLNLNGHMIEFATVPQRYARYGISGFACWDPSLSNGEANGAPCGGPFDNFVLVGPGNIVQGRGASPYSHPVRFGQGLFSGPVIHDVDFTWHAESSIAVEINYAGAPVTGGAKIFNCTFHNNVTAIHNRHGQEGQSVKVEQAKSVLNPTFIYRNTVIGGAQGGLYTEAPGSEVYANNVSQAGTYSNDFGIYAWGPRMAVHDNVVRPAQGRGIFISGVVAPTTGTTVSSNRVEVIEKANNGEYNGCELGGAYGVQFDDNASHATSGNNVVTAYAKECNGAGLRLTGYGPANQSANNTYTGKLLSGFTPGAIATGLSLNSGAQPPFVARNDTFIGDTSSVYVDWDGAAPLTCISCTLGSGATPEKYRTFSFSNGGVPVKAGGLHFQDTSFTGLASKTSTNMQAQDENHRFAEYWIDWTYTLSVQDQTGKPVSGAAVRITNALGESVYSGTTNHEGKISAVLSEFRMYNTPTEVKTERQTPHHVDILKKGCQQDLKSSVVSVTQTTTQTVQVACAPK